MGLQPRLLHAQLHPVGRQGRRGHLRDPAVPAVRGHRARTTRSTPTSPPSAAPNKGTSWGASAWAAADEFKAIADKIVAEGGPNAITRAKFLDTIKDFNAYNDNGFIGTRDQRKYSECQVVLQVQNGKFVRVQPTEAGKFDCNPAYLTPIAVDPTTAFKG